MLVHREQRFEQVADARFFLEREHGDHLNLELFIGIAHRPKLDRPVQARKEDRRALDVFRVGVGNGDFVSRHRQARGVRALAREDRLDERCLTGPFVDQPRGHGS